MKRGHSGLECAHMSEKEQPSSKPEGKLKDGSKKPYHKPTVRSERVFEQQALACGKIGTTQASCRLNRKRS